MMNTKRTKVAIAYDFDGTLARGNIQENSFLPDVGISKEEFWQEVQEISKKNEMDDILAYMYLLIQKASNSVKIDKESLRKHGKNAIYFKGVEDFFQRINKYAKKVNIKLEHYIVSSGTKEMIEGTSIANHFKFIYASSFKYDQHNVPEWPALAINYTTKTQFLFRINKGINNSWDNTEINSFKPEDERAIPFKHMIYIGDGLTDVPAMKLVSHQGGTSIGVYDPQQSENKNKVQKLLAEKRVSYIAEADYSNGSEIDTIIKSKLNSISIDNQLKAFSRIDNPTR